MNVPYAIWVVSFVVSVGSLAGFILADDANKVKLSRSLKGSFAAGLIWMMVTYFWAATIHVALPLSH